MILLGFMNKYMLALMTEKEFSVITKPGTGQKPELDKEGIKPLLMIAKNVFGVTGVQAKTAKINPDTSFFRNFFTSICLIKGRMPEPAKFSDIQRAVKILDAGWPEDENDLRILTYIPDEQFMLVDNIDIVEIESDNMPDDNDYEEDVIEVDADPDSFEAGLAEERAVEFGSFEQLLLYAKKMTGSGKVYRSDGRYFVYEKVKADDQTIDITASENMLRVYAGKKASAVLEHTNAREIGEIDKRTASL